MANINRGRDLPRAPQHKRFKIARTDDDARENAKRRDRVIKKLAKIVHSHGFDTLFGGGTKGTEKSEAKEKMFVIEALALGIVVHPQLLEFHGLTAEPNPYSEPDDGKAPF